MNGKTESRLNQEALEFPKFREAWFEVIVTKFTICIIIFCGCLGLVLEDPQVHAG